MRIREPGMPGVKEKLGYSRLSTEEPGHFGQGILEVVHEEGRRWRGEKKND